MWEFKSHHGSFTAVLFHPHSQVQSSFDQKRLLLLLLPRMSVDGNYSSYSSCLSGCETRKPSRKLRKREREREREREKRGKGKELSNVLSARQTLIEESHARREENRANLCARTNSSLHIQWSKAENPHNGPAAQIWFTVLS